MKDQDHTIYQKEKTMKKRLVVFMALTIFISTLSGLGFPLKITAAGEPLTLAGGSTFYAVAGEPEDYEVGVRNDSDDTIYDLRVTPLSGEVTAYIVGSTDIADGGSARLYLNFYSAGPTNGLKAIPLEFSYNDGNPANTEKYIILVYLYAYEIETPTTPPPTPTPSPTPTPIPKTPALTQTAPRDYATAPQGKATSITVTLRNDTKFTARDIRIQHLVSPNFSLSIEGVDTAFSLSPNQTRTITVKVTPDANLAGKKYELAIPYTFTNDDGVADGDVIMIYMNVPALPDVAATPTPAPAVPLVVQTAPRDYAKAERGAQTSFTMTLTNDSVYEAREIRFNHIVYKDFSFRIEGEDYTFNIAPGQSKDITVYVTPDMTVAGGKHDSLVIPYTYKSADGRYTGEGAAVIYVEVDGLPEATPEPTQSPPVLLVIRDYSITPTNVKYGDTFTIKGTVANISASDAFNAQIAVTGLTGGLGIPNGPVDRLLGSIPAGGTVSFEFTIAVSENITTGIYPVAFDLSATGPRGEAASGGGVFSLMVTGKPSDTEPTPTPKPQDIPQARLTASISSPPESVTAGDTFMVTINLTNNGAFEATNVRVESRYPSVLLPRTASIVLVDSIKPGETKSVTFEYTPTKDAISQNYLMEYGFSYNSGVMPNGDKLTEGFTQYGSVNVLNKETGPTGGPNKSVPKVIVSNYAVTPQSGEVNGDVLAGQEFDLFLEFQNTHMSKAVYNIKITLSSTSTERGAVFSTVGASNTIYVGKIEPGEYFKNDLRMYCIVSAAVKNHIIYVDFEYEDEDGNPYTQREEVGVNVTQDYKIEIGTVNMMMYVPAGGFNWIDFSIQNTGRIPVYNLKVWVEGEGYDFSSGSEKIFGNMASGGYNYYNGNFNVPYMAGSCPMTIKVQYDLDSGKRIVDEYEYVIEVYEDYYGGGGDWPSIDIGYPEYPGIDGPGTDIPGEDKPAGFLGISLVIWICAGGGVVVIAAAVVITLVIRAKKRKGRLDE